MEEMVEIGILGAGTVAQSFAAKAIEAGHMVVLSNSGSPARLEQAVRPLGPMASAGSAEAAASREVVLLAVPWPKVESILKGLPGWNGRILIDATNAFKDGTPAHGLAQFGKRSSSELVATWAPGARVVKALNSLFMSNFNTPAPEGFRRAVFISGDDAAARTLTGDLFETFGFAPVDLGSLKSGGTIQSVGGPIAGHDLHLPWPAPRAFPQFSGSEEEA